MPVDVFSIDHTYTLLDAVRRIDEPLSFLADAFFPNKTTVMQDYVAIEYQREGRRLAPYIIDNTRGVNISRESSKVNYYHPPLFGPRRVISLRDVSRRMFGEQPNIYTPVTPEERAAQLQAQDLVELLRMHANRRGQMASEILQTGKVAMKAYADDGTLTADETIEFDWNGAITPTVSWNDSAADIYGDLYSASERIQRQAGMIPTLAICGKNIERYLFKNKEMRDWLMIPNRQNLNMLNFEPKYKSPQVRHIGYIGALNLELVSYTQTYRNDAGEMTPYVGDDTLIMGVPGRGREVHAPVTIFQQGQWHTIAAPYVPLYVSNDDAQSTALTVFSRYILIPETVDDWICLKVGSEGLPPLP